MQPNRLKKLLNRMVDIYSPSGKEGDLLDFLRGYFKRRGLPVTEQAVDDERCNLIVGPLDREIHLGLVGHLDTVPAFDLDTYGFSERDDLMKGLGTADMKGGCAAMIEAYLNLHESGNALPPVALCLLVGEEENGDGAEALMKAYRFPWAIIGEPTDLVPCLSSYGYLECQIATQGRRVHASLSKPEQHAIEAMFRTVLQLSQHISQNRSELVYNIRDLFSSPAGFAVPEHCEAWLDVHVPPQIALGKILTEFEEMIPRGMQKTSGIEVSFRPATIDAGYELPERGFMVEALQTVLAQHRLPWRTDPFRSHSDANQIWAGGTKPILLGPGQLGLAHSQEESVSFEQVCLAAQIYQDVIQVLSSGKEWEGSP